MKTLKGQVFHVFCQMGVIIPTADQALYAKDRVFWVGHSLAFCRLAHKALVFGKGNDRRRGPCALCIFDYPGCDPSMIDTQLFVVPRSIPMTLAIS